MPDFANKGPIALGRGLESQHRLAPSELELVKRHIDQPLEALGGVKVYLAKNSYLSLGAGRGLMPERAGNPDFRGVIGIVFEPKPAQRAAAQIPDDAVAVAPPPKRDEQPRDSDNDGIFDHDDSCIEIMEDYDGVDDEDGCPDYNRIIEKETEIVTLQPIEFEFDKDVLRDSAYPILDEVVNALHNNPAITLIEVEGHTDERGTIEYNLALGQRRADAVRDYMTSLGLAATRLRTVSYGEERPAQAGTGETAWGKNRRAEFKVE